MIAATSRTSQLAGANTTSRWQRLLAEAVSDPRELCVLLEIDPDLIAPAMQAAASFALRVPRGYLAKMRRGDPRDPLLLQVLPALAESLETTGYTFDPVGDLNSRAAPGVLHKYQGRALLIATGACAVHCRYCFRRHFPYAEEAALVHGWEGALRALAQDTSIEEVILSGGDPLSLSDRRLQQLTQELHKLAHIRRLRIHTRYPVVLPERIDDGLLGWLEGVRLHKVVVIHANHPHEIDGTVASACRLLQRTGATLLNQSVLLAGINDALDTLCELSHALFEAGVLPYYLHVLDKVAGAAHFDVDARRACELHAGMTQRLPGYLVPRLVREVAGAASKVPVGPE